MVYVDLVMALNFLVDYLLLLGANSLSGHPPEYRKTALASVVGGIYGGVCVLPEFTFLGSTLWRLVFLGLMAGIAYGFDRGAIRRGVLFFFLSMALGGIALGLNGNGITSLVAAAAGLCLMCFVGFPRKSAGRTYRKVELEHRGRRRVLMALYDTGNQLRDPLTGRDVLVVGAEAARDIMGLTQSQLSEPVKTVVEVPGLRLIPYRAVGQPGGFLLAVKMDAVFIDGNKWDGIVAFAPQNLGRQEFEALAGGAI